MSFTETLNLIIKSTAGNLSTPFSLGTGYKFHYLKKKYNLSYSQNININLYFSIFTNLIFVFFLLIISFSEYIQGNPIFGNLVFFWLLILVLGLMLFYLLSIEYEFGRLKFLNSYSLLSLNLSLSNIINMTIFTFLLISINIITHLYLFKLIDIQISIVQIFSFVCISGLANIIKLTPGNFGINETVLIIANLYHGLTPVEVVVVSLIIRFFAWFNILIFYFILNIQKFNSKNGE